MGDNHRHNVVAKFGVTEFRYFLHDAALGLGGGTAGRTGY